MNFSIKQTAISKEAPKTSYIYENLCIFARHLARKEVHQRYSVFEEPVISPDTSLGITDACYITQFSSVVKLLIAGSKGGSYVTPVTGIEMLTCFK